MLEKHRRETVNRLILGDSTELGRRIGDVNCQMRTLFVLDTYWKAQNDLRHKRRLRSTLAIFEKIKRRTPK